MELLIDLSSITNGREQYFFELTMAAFPTAIATVVAPEASIGFSANAQMKTFPSTFNPTERSTFLYEVFSEFSSNLDSLPKDEKRVVLSFQINMRDKVSEINHPQLSFQDLRDIVYPQKINTWPENVMPLEEAISVLMRAISAQKDAYIRMSSLRPALERVDDRFAKVPGNPLGTSGIIKVLIRAAQEKGCVETGGNDDANPFVFLKKALITPTTNSTSVPVASVSPTVISSSTPLPKSSNHESSILLSTQFITCLRNAHLGPFQDVRVAIYREIDDISIRHLPMFQLITDAVTNVRKKVEEARSQGRQYLVTSKRNLPWSRVREFIEELMQRVSCMRVEEEFVPLRWEYMERNVDGMAKGWDLALDSIMLLHLIDKGYEISTRTLTDLSGALYNTRHNHTQSRRLIAYVLNNKMCIEDERCNLRRS